VADVVVRLEAGNAQKLLDRCPEGSLARPDQVELRDKLRAALDSPPVEERVEERVTSDQGVVVYPAEAEEMGSEELREIAQDYAQTPNVTNVRIQTRAVVTTPWTDLPSEEGER